MCCKRSGWVWRRQLCQALLWMSFCSWVLSELTLRFCFATSAAQLTLLNSAVPMTLIYSKYWSLACRPLNIRCCTTQAFRRDFYYAEMPLQTELELLRDWPYLATRLETITLRKYRHHPREVVCALGWASSQSISTHLGSALSRSSPECFFIFLLEDSYKAVINSEMDMLGMRASDLQFPH